MEPIEFIQPYFYNLVYYTTFLILCWFTVLYYIGSAQQKILHAEGSPIQSAALFVSLIVIYFLGLRQVAGEFGDTFLYAYDYYRLVPEYVPINLRTEWLWDNLRVFCKINGFSINEFFLLVEFFYIGCMFVCSLILMRKNLWISMLFFLVAFSSYSFGTNGIRNGLACSVMLVSLSLFTEQGGKRIFSFALMFIAVAIHRTAVLPSAAAIGSLFFIKDTKWAIRFWLASIALSLVVGSAVTQLFSALGFDDRMAHYAADASADTFSHTGFRWDFLLYSFFPVAMIWYVTRHRKFSSKTYTILANTYLLCNAFWIMVIRASYSNRFAYLSWFLYPVVMAYPLLRMNLWKDQDRKTAIILFLYSGFTFFMYFIYYFGQSNGFRGFDLYWWKR